MLIVIAFEVLVGFGVKGGFGVVGDEFSIYPLVQLVLGAFPTLAKLCAERFELCLVEAVGQVVEHVLRAAFAGFGCAGVALFQQVGEELHLAPQVVVDEPFHQLTHRLRPSLVVEYPKHAACLPARD